MEILDIKAILSNYCNLKGWVFINTKARFDEQIQITQEYNDKPILVVMQSITEGFRGATVNSVEYNLMLMLGRKFDNVDISLTHSALEETYTQKENRRLIDLRNLLRDLIVEIKCNNDLTLNNNVTYEELLNHSDENIDFIVVENLSLNG